MSKEEAINNLKRYIEEDFAFREPIKNLSDFDKFCYNHCKDIETVLGYVKELEEEKDKLKEGLVKRIAYCNELEKDLFENCENYVVNKSKIRDKIEELEKTKENYNDSLRFYTLKDSFTLKENVLKELLEEE